MSIKNEPVPRDVYNAHMAERDARIAELTAEVERYKAALEEIEPLLRGNGAWCDDLANIARNALREG